MGEEMDSDQTYLLKSDETESKKRKPKKASKARKGLILACCFFMQVVSNGVGYGLGVMYVAIHKEFDAPRTEAALVQSIFMGVMTAGGIMYAPFLRRYGTGLCVVMGTMFGCAGLVVSAFSNEIYMVIIFTGVIGGIGISINYLAPFITASLLFRENAAVPLVFLSTGSSVGQFIFPYLYEVFISQFGWRGAFILVSGIALNSVPVGLFVYMCRKYMSPYQEEQETDGQTDKKTCRCSCDVSLLSDVMIWLILSVCFLLGSTGNTEAWFLVDLMTIRGYERQTGSLLVSMIGFANFFGRSTGVLLRFKLRVPTIYHWIYCLPVLGLAHFLVLTFTSYVPLLVSCLLYGYTFGMTISQKPAVMFEAAGLLKYANGMGLVNICYGTGNFFGGLIGGIINDTYGVYDPMFYLAIAASLYMSLASTIVVIIMKRRKRHEGRHEGRQDGNQISQPDTKYKSTNYQTIKEDEC